MPATDLNVGLLSSRGGSFFSLSLSWARSIDRCQIRSIGRTTGTCTGCAVTPGDGTAGGVGVGNLEVGMGEFPLAEEDPGSRKRQPSEDFGCSESLCRS